MSAELIAVSSIFTYDIYQTYINPKADGKFLIRMSHVSCVVYAIIMAGFATGLFYAGVGMGYLYVLMGCIIGSAVLPATLSLMWKDQNWIAAAASPVLGLIVALIAWLVTAKQECGILNVDCTGSNNPMLAGNVAALLSPLVFVPVLTYAFGRQKYDWQSMRDIRRGDDTEIVKRHSVDLEQVPGHVEINPVDDEAEQAMLKKRAIIARSLTGFMTLAFLVLWPMPMYGSGYVFSKKFFTGKFRLMLCKTVADLVQAGSWSEFCGCSSAQHAWAFSRFGRGVRPWSTLSNLCTWICRVRARHQSMARSRKLMRMTREL